LENREGGILPFFYKIVEQLGISLYLSSGEKTNQEVIKKAEKAHMKYAFTSLHIPEEVIADYSTATIKLMEQCRDAGLSLIIDVGPRTLSKLGLSSLQDLKKYNITHIRIDYGFEIEEIVKLTNDFNIVLNASTLTEEEIKYIISNNVDTSKISACHNFYPKPLTALSIENVRATNDLLHKYNIKSIGFVSGDLTLRGPLHEGLPTVEEHRHMDVLRQILELKQLAKCDLIMIGDIDITEESWKKIGELQNNYITLKAKILSEYNYICNKIHHDRVDYSMYVIRSVESREYKNPIILSPERRGIGSISMSNSLYLRYEGELEIARRELKIEPKVNVIGQVMKKYLQYLPYINSGMGFKIEEEVEIV
jgi:hypothetical protein